VILTVQLLSFSTRDSCIRVIHLFHYLFPCPQVSLAEVSPSMLTSGDRDIGFTRDEMSKQA